MNILREMKITAGLLIVAPLLFASCNKYEDGPRVSLKSKKERVANTWKIETAYRDEEIVTSSYDNFTLRMEKDGDAELTTKYELGALSFETETDGQWDFANKKEELVFDYEDNDADNTYKILRLTEDELWMVEVGGEDELHLMPK